MLKTVHIIDDFSSKSGGTAEAVRNIVNATVQSGYRSVVICNKQSDYDLVCEQNVDIKSANAFPTKYGLSISLIKLLLREVADCNHVYIHGVWQWHSIATAVVCVF